MYVQRSPVAIWRPSNVAIQKPYMVPETFITMAGQGCQEDFCGPGKGLEWDPT